MHGSSGLGRLVSDVVQRAVVVVGVGISTAFCGGPADGGGPVTAGHADGWPARPWSRGRSDLGEGGPGSVIALSSWPPSGTLAVLQGLRAGSPQRQHSCGRPALLSFLVQAPLPAVGRWARLPSTGWSVVLWTVFASRAWALMRVASCLCR